KRQWLSNCWSLAVICGCLGIVGICFSTSGPAPGSHSHGNSRKLSPAEERRWRTIEGGVVLAREQYVDVSRMRSDKDGAAKIRLPWNAKSPGIYVLKPGAGYDCFSAFQRGKSNLPTTVDAPSRLKLTLDGAQTIRVVLVRPARSGRECPRDPRTEEKPRAVLWAATRYIALLCPR